MSEASVHWTQDPQRMLPRKVEELDSSAAQRKNTDKQNLRLYYGRSLSAPRVDVTRPSQALAEIDGARAGGFSLVRQVVDAAASLIVRVPAVRVVPVGEEFSRQKAAKLQGRFVNGVFHANDVERLADRVWIGGATTRVGGLKWYVDPQTYAIKCEPVYSLRLLWDDAEGVSPRNLYQITPITRRVLQGMYPAKAYDIERAPRWSDGYISGVEFSSGKVERDTVKLVEAWSLPIGKEPGRHVIMVGETVLVDEEYEHERFPFALFRWSESHESFGGRPLADVLVPYQLWTNRITRMIDEAHKGAGPKLVVHESAEIPGGWSDKTWDLIRYRGPVPPQVVVPQVVGPEIYNWREALKREAFEEGGVSTALAQGTKPAGLSSAVALREYQDIASTRLIRATKRFEAFFRDCAEIVLMLARDTYKGSRKARVVAPGTRVVEEIDWSAIDPLKEDEYTIQVQTVSALPLTVAGRLDFVKDLMATVDETGKPLISGKDGLRLMQIPDVETALDRETAMQDLAERQVEAALWEGEYLPPEPIQGAAGLALVVDIGGKELMRALQNPSFPPAHLELCRRLIAEAELLQKAQQAASAPPAPEPMAQAPGAVPQP